MPQGQPHGLILANGHAAGWLYHDAADGVIEQHGGRSWKYSTSDAAWHEVPKASQGSIATAIATAVSGAQQAAKAASSQRRSPSMEERQTSMQWVPGVPGGREGHWDRRPAAGASFVDPSGWAQQPAQAARRPATRPGSRPSAGAAQQGWYASGGIAYRSSDNKRLGRIVPGSHYQVAEETNGGKLWSVGTLHADGKVSDWKPYGSVPGLPPPSNAQQPEQYAQPSRRPAYAPAPAPQYVYPSPQPVYASPLPTPVAAAPAYYGSPLPTPVYAQPPVYASPLPPQDGAPYGLDPFTGQPLTAAQASVYAQYGAQSAAAQFTQGQQAAGQLDQLTMSIMMGGGATDDGYGGMIGGMDASTLAMLSGGDADLALQMALANGGYDPTAGDAFLNPIPGQV